MKVRSRREMKQKRRILLVAIYALKKFYGVACPEKRRVLDFIRDRELIHIRSEDKEYRLAGEMVWQHDLSWMRNELKNDGLLCMPERGIWQITQAGERDVEVWAQRIKEQTDANPKWSHDFTVHSDPSAEFDDDFHQEYVITEETVRLGRRIAENALQ